jgi:hypothetical protein
MKRYIKYMVCEGKTEVEKPEKRREAEIVKL